MAEFEVKNKNSVKYVQAMIIYFVVVVVAQLAFSNMWSGELKKIDLFQIIIAPACCFSIATLAGWYRNAITAIFSGLWVFALGVFFYLSFQKFTFFSGSNYENLLLVNINNMGTTIIASGIISTLIIAVVINYKPKK